MGMLLRRHYATVEPVKPVEQTETVSVEEKPIEDEIQAVVEEVTPEEPKEAEPEKEEKPKRTRTVAKKPTKRKLTRKSK